MSDTQAARAAFEAWASTDGRTGSLERYSDHAREYKSIETGIAWEAWLAASRSIPAAEIEAAYKRGWNDREADILERAGGHDMQQKKC